jgi:hypothetical protein
VRLRASLLLVALPVAGAAFASAFGGCSTQGTSATDGGAGVEASDDSAAGSLDAAGPDSADSSPADSAVQGSDSATGDSAASDGGADADAASPFVTGASIVSGYGTPLQGAPGDAIPLVVMLTLSDGTTRAVPADQVSWVAPQTLVAEDPYDAGADIVPEAGAQPTAFYVRNDLRGGTPGTLFILDRGSVASPLVTVSASIPDGGEVSANVAVLPAPVGDAAAGGDLFLHVLVCNGCHGQTAGGSPLAVLPDGGPILLDGGPAYVIGGQLYSFPAPGLNAAPGSGHVAVDPAWSEPMFAVAAQSDMDNKGVALRLPMPLWAGGNNGTGNPLNAQNFADIYAWLKTQTQ